MYKLYEPIFEDTKSMKDMFLKALGSFVADKKKQAKKAVSDVKDTAKAGKENVSLSAKIADLQALTDEVRKRSKKIKEKYKYEDSGKTFPIEKIRELNSGDASMIEKMDQAIEKAQAKIDELSGQKKKVNDKLAGNPLKDEPTTTKAPEKKKSK